MASNWWNRFNQSWANNGLLDDPIANDANSGWAYIGQSPPTVEQFNSVFQWADKKDNWLYNQIANAIIAGGGTPSEGNNNGLVDAINDIIGTGNEYLPLSGGTLTGFLTLSAHPINPFHAATKEYIDNKIAYNTVPAPPGGYGNGMLQPYGSGQYRMMLSNTTFIIPPTVTSIRVRVVGAGGNATTYAGGGGEYAHGIFQVTEGTTYAVTVGTGTTSFGALISAISGGNGTASIPGVGGKNGIGGDVRFAGGAGGPRKPGDGGGGTIPGAGPISGGSGGGAAGSILGIGGGGTLAVGCGGNSVGSYVSGINSDGGSSPFSNSPDNITGGTWGAPDAVGTIAKTATTNGTLRVGPTMPRFAGESLTGGGGASAGGASGTTGGTGGDGAGGGGGASNNNGAQGGIFAGGGGGGVAYVGGPGGLGGGGGCLNGAGGRGWMVVEW